MITKSIKTKLKKYFFLNPTIKLRVRQIERAVNIPFPSVVRYTKELEKERILKSEKIANIKVYSANRSSQSYLIEKKLFNIKNIYSSGLREYLKLEYSNPLIILFGSYSRGEDIENSDIDLYIETTKRKINIEKFEKKLKRKIQLFLYKNIHSIKNKDLTNNIINGITINNQIEVFR